MAQMVVDPDFLADARTMKIDLDPLGGEALQDLIRSGMTYSPDVVARAETFVQPD